MSVWINFSSNKKGKVPGHFPFDFTDQNSVNVKWRFGDYLTLGKL